MYNSVIKKEIYLSNLYIEIIAIPINIIYFSNLY